MWCFFLSLFLRPLLNTNFVPGAVLGVRCIKQTNKLLSLLLRLLWTDKEGTNMYLIIVQSDQHCMIGTNVETEGETSNSQVWEGFPKGDEVFFYILED